MISVTERSKCCGCGACRQRCPKHCISMQEDEQGFMYPQVDNSICIDCGLCEKVCPVINQDKPHRPISTFAAKNPNEKIRMRSSSGGIFTMLAEKVINDGGVIFGAKFNDKWEVVHDYTETIEGLEAYRGSKYVQSYIGNCFNKTEEFLKQGRKVLFSGTPCQIAGLKKFLRKKYDNLLTVDVICHGVPSPLVWRDYLKYVLRPQGEVGKKSVSSSANNAPVLTGVSFRDKTTGWKKSGFILRVKSAIKADKNSVLSPLNPKEDYVYLHETLDKNIFMQGFLKNLYLRPSCYACPSKSGKSCSDITIGDFWGIAQSYPIFDDDKGIGLVLVSTTKGRKIYDSLIKNDIKVAYEEGIAGNPAIEHSCEEPKQQPEFWEKYAIGRTACIMPIVMTICPSLITRCLSFAKRIVKRIIRMI